MQGYGTMAMEADEQFAAAANAAPTHIFVQAGVGSLAGAAVGYFANKYPDNPPVFAVVESDQADCLYRSACAGDGSIRTVGGDMRTIMAGLACGEPSITSWQILKDKVAAFASLPDRVARRRHARLGRAAARRSARYIGRIGRGPARLPLRADARRRISAAARKAQNRQRFARPAVLHRRRDRS